MSFRWEPSADSPRLEAVIQKLEESFLQSDSSSEVTSFSVQDDGHDTDFRPLPASTRIHHSITRGAAELPPSERSEDGDQLGRRSLREPVCLSEMDYEHTPDKQTSVTDLVDQMLTLHAADSDQESVFLQNKERAYSQRLQLYQEAQGRQAQLVEKLQTKVLQYKKRCGELEELALEKTSDLEKMRLLLQTHLDRAQRQQQTEQDLNTAIEKKCFQLEEEQKRCASLSRVNSVLREQLEQAGTVNQELTESLWKVQEDVELWGNHLQKEQETRAPRLTREQPRVKVLWRQASSLQCSFTHLRTFTDRTLSDMRGEFVAVRQQLRSVCMSLEARAVQNSTSSGAEISALEKQLRDKLKEALQHQSQWDTEKVRLNSRILELSDTVKHLRGRNNEKDASLAAAHVSLDTMEKRRTEDKADMKDLRTEIQTLQKILSQVHKLVGGKGSDNSLAQPDWSALKNNTVMAVQSALSKHQKQAQDLRGCLDAALEQVDDLRRHLQERDSEKRELELKVQEVLRESQEAKTSLAESIRDSSRYCRSLELISSEKDSQEKLVSGLQQEVDSQRAELEALQGSSLELQRTQDFLMQQREDLEMQLTRQQTEAQRGKSSLEELEEKHSQLRRELVTVKENLNQITLQKEVLEEDKASLSLAVSKLESQGSAQEVAITKLQSQEANLKNSLSKMVVLSKGLAKDKVELNRILLQKEGEKAELDERRREAEVERAAAREETARVQQEIMNLLAEKQVLDSSHSHMHNLCQKLEAELSLLQREKTQALEQHSQVTRQMQVISEELYVCKKELETKSTSLKRATQDREELAKEKAALDVNLNSTERKAYGLMQELVALRAEKESLEAALFESQAENTRIEEEKHGLLLTNEALTRDSACKRVEAEQQLAQAAEKEKTLVEKLTQSERQARVTLNKMEEIHRDQLETERQKHERRCVELRFQWEQAEEQLRRQCQEQRVCSQQELQQVQEEQAKLQQDFNKRLLQAESEKQQALSQKEAEKAALTERFTALQHDLATAHSELEHTKRESLSKHEQDKNVIAALRYELKELRTEFEESLNSHENTKKSFAEQVRELNKQREHAEKELEGLRQQTQAAQDALVKGQQELIELHRELQECAQERDRQRKEALDQRRLLGDESREREAVQSSNQELRVFVKRAESENKSLKRALEERNQKVAVLEECRSSMDQEANALRSSVRDLEKTRLQARRDLQELRRQVKILESESSRQKQELQELQARLFQEERKEEEARREAFSLRQKVLECEAGRDAALNEVAVLQCHLLEMESKEQQSQELLQEKEAFLQQSGQQHRDTYTQMKDALENAKDQVRKLTARVVLSEQKCEALQRQLNQSEAKSKDLDLKLTRLCSAVRLTVHKGH
uniref:Ciliary rootlet coiled-coil, rootletin family member 2 n=1 Tax=Cynoglossus semilaevis TaxID=244447 RepID=A0A3P8URD3_CYNSE